MRPIKIKYGKYRWVELNWYKFYRIPFAIYNLIGNRGTMKEKFKRLSEIKITW